MLKQINNIVNIMMGSVIGVFIGRSIYVCLDYKMHPDLYAWQSAPWYTSIIINGLFTGFCLLAAVVIKWLIRKRMK